MAITYTLIATVSPTSSATLFDFNNIPSTYTDLRLVVNQRSSDGNNQWIGGSMSINGGAADANINYQRMFTYNTNGSNTNVADTSAGGFPMCTGTNATAQIYGPGTIYFPNYRSSNYKQAYFRGSSANITAGTALTIQVAANIAITNPITRITFSASSYAFTTASTVSLYGILKA